MRVVATAGHVDHGKSTLVQALTGTDPDRFVEEKRRGLTIDLGFAHTVLPSGAGISFVDVPGHSRFVANMLSGASAVDAAMFIVAATDGWMPQSEEHLRILELFGIDHGLIVLTKRDQVDDELAALAQLDVESRVEGTFLEGAPIIEVAAINGDGIEDLRAALDVLVASTPASVDRGRPRLWVDRVFSATGSGTVVTGTLVDGSIAVDDSIVVQPGEHEGRVRSIQTLGAPVDQIGPGNRVALNLAGVAHDVVGRGSVVVTPDRWHLTDRVDASLEVLGDLDHSVSRRGAFVVYVGSREIPAQMRVLGVDELEPGQRGAVRLFFPVALPLLPGDRYVLRESGRSETVGGGEILDIDPVLRAAEARPDRTVERVVSERGWMDVDQLELLTGERHEPIVGRWIASGPELAAATERLQDLVAADPAGVDLATLEPYERALVEAADWAMVESGRARPAGSADPYENHPLIATVLAGGFSPELPTDHDVAAKRELVRRGVLVERDQVVFHADIVERAGLLAAELLRAQPDGFTVAELRDLTSTSRKFALALVAELDGRGVTRRRGDQRIGGPRLPALDEPDQT